MFYDPIIREDEIDGLTPLEVYMYDLAWSHNKDCLGFAGLCALWYRKIDAPITLKSVSIVWQRLQKYSFFRTDAYWMIYNEGKVMNDYVPHL